jgi:hypothetical protein
MSIDLKKLPGTLDLGPMCDTWSLAAEHSELEKEILGKYYKNARVYVTGSYTSQGHQFHIFPHIIVDNEGKNGDGRAHYSHAAGGGPHMNPHVWGYEGNDALYVDNFAIQQTGYKSYCAILGDFMQKACKTSIKKMMSRPGGVGSQWQVIK